MGWTVMDVEYLAEKLMRRFEKVVERLRAGHRDAAIEEFGRIGGLLRGDVLKAPERLFTAFVDAFIDLFRQSERFDLVVKVTEEAEGLLGADPEWSFARGEALFTLGHFEEAHGVLEPLARGDFEESMVLYYLACIAERREEHRKAKTLFEKAHRLSPESCKVPVPMTEEKAVEVYRECLAELPEEIRHSLEDVPIYVDDLPSDELITSDSPPLDPLVMGVFLGQPAGEERTSWPDDQPRIILFHKNIAKAEGDMKVIKEELRTTLFHEIGHALGFEEPQLEEMGLA